ncbi:MAG TPA: hypothetical protein VHL09_17525, partial [Dehalococcoidia bacterium]|nr:hypothetical protein [Dehalococcoidia bacterium]
GHAAQANITGDGTTVEPVDGPVQEVRSAAQHTGAWILPANRILTYYGFPTNPYMGILGEYGVNDDLDGLRERLMQQAAEYEAADPSRPVKLGFEVIASVAQAGPGADGMFLVYTDDELVQQYLDYTAEHDMLLFLDYQFGMHSVEDELEAARSWLEHPHVHLALDPEFKMLPGEQPGVDLGSIDAADIKKAQSFLEDLSAEHGLPPKVLVVHQFYYTMITNKDQLAPAEGMQLVIDMDGHGDPDLKRESYSVVITQQPIEFHGIKLFYPFDEPLMTAAEVVALTPPPDMVIYQ